MAQVLERAQEILDPAEIMPRVIGRYSPLHIDHGKGIYVWDVNGERYADFTSGIAVVNTGHCHPHVVAAIQDQAARIIHAQANILAHSPMLRAAQLLTETTAPNLNQVFWTNSGAEAVTSSRVKVRGHYEPLISSVYLAPFPYMFRSPYKGAPEDADLYYFAELEALFDQLVMPDDVAGMLIETVVGEGGYLVPTKRWLQMVRALCDKHGIMLILDEVQSGMGRTGKMWAYEHFDIVPDIMTTAKGLASGMPVAAVVADRAQMDKWAPGSHGGTYGGNAVGTAAAAATLEVMRDEDLPGNAARMGAILIEGLREIQADYPVIGDVRGLGLMVATEFVNPDGSPNPEAVKQVVARAFENKTLLITCGTYDQAIRIVPPLVVNEEQIRDFLDVYRRAVASVA